MEDKKKRRRKIAVRVAAALFVWWAIVAVYQAKKPLPTNVSFEGNVWRVQEDDFEFLYDLTYRNAKGEKIIEQQIFDRFFEIVDGAKQFIVIDAFLFNTDFGARQPYKKLTGILKEKLIAKKKAHPEMPIIFTTDPINTFYGSYKSDELEEMEKAGVRVVVTDLTKLRDSNPYYGSVWRTYLQWFGSEGKGWIKHPLGRNDKQVTVRSFLSLFNTKANHRKLLVADEGDTLVSLVTSANPHEASSQHSNVAFLVRGAVAEDILKAEQAVFGLAGEAIAIPLSKTKQQGGPVVVQFLTEGKIKKAITSDIQSLQKGDTIDLAMFYFSDRDLVKTILAAAQRGVSVRIILDPNKDAFAREKSGIPNRQVAYELKSKGAIPIRWYNTAGEQFHTKMIILRKGDVVTAYAGSANYTRRNLDDLNLEADLKVTMPAESRIARKITDYFERIWSNENGNVYTLPFESFKDDSFLKNVLYRLQEFSGFSSY